MPLSVLQFAAGMPNWGGAEIHLLNLSEQLRRRGHDVTIACQPDRYVEAEAQKRGFATIPITLTRQHDRRDLLHLCRYLRGHPTDVLHAHAPNDFLLPPLTALIAGVPVRLMTRHFPHSLRNRPGAWIYSNLLFSRIVTVSESVRQTLIASGMTQNRVETIYHGTDVKEFAATTQTPKESRRLLGISEGTVAVGIIGRIAEEKGHQFVLEAMRLIGKNFPVHLVIIGDGPQEETMKNLVREGDLCDRVTFTGFRSDINNAVSALDIVVVASTWAEPCSAVVQQGMALGKSVIGTRTGGTPEMIVEGETGLLVPPEDSRSLADAIVRLAGNSNLRNQMGAAGRKRVEELFSLTVMTDKIEDLYHREYAKVRGQRALESVLSV
jgi:glycosyltransferase involved in cell wall biosynthesis